MPWVKLDCDFPEHPKVEEVGDLAAWLYVCGLAYCGRFLTDGRIPVARVPKLTGLQRPLQLAQRLVDAGLWMRDEDEFEVHDYLRWQQSSEQIKDQRDAAKVRAKRSRSSRARTPARHTEVREPEVDVDTDTPQTPVSEERAPAEAGQGDQSLWNLVAKREAKRTEDQGKRIHDLPAFLASVSASMERKHSDKATALKAEHPDLTDLELARVVCGEGLPARHRVTKVEVLDQDPNWRQNLQAAKSVLGPKQTRESA